MKSARVTMTFSGLLAMFAVASSLQAADIYVPSLMQEPTVMLAEGGSARPLHYQMHYQMQRNDAIQARDNQSQGFVRLLEEHPTASGQQLEPEQAGAVKQPPTDVQVSDPQG